MDFLKSTLSSALSKGPPFPYTFHDRVTLPGDTPVGGVFNLFNGTKREDSSACSIFTFEATDASRTRLPLAKNALRRLRTLRHPGVVRVLDSVEVRGNKWLEGWDRADGMSADRCLYLHRYRAG